jgi:hypothetical protein
MGQKLEVEWQETVPELRKRYRKERHCERCTRLHALWQLHYGKSLTEVAELVGIAYQETKSPGVVSAPGLWLSLCNPFSSAEAGAG